MRVSFWLIFSLNKFLKELVDLNKSVAIKFVSHDVLGKAMSLTFTLQLLNAVN